MTSLDDSRRGPSIGSPLVRVETRFDAAPSDWYNDLGIEWWPVSLSLTYVGANNDPQYACVAQASLYRVDCNLVEEFSYDLDNISADLGEIGTAINDSEEHLLGRSTIGGKDSAIVIAEDVAVDKFWRGGRLGPALLFFAADLLRAKAVFLTPVALHTRVDPKGICRTDYERARPEEDAQAKVRSAWRKAGYRKLAGDVVWVPIDSSDGTNARKRLTQMEEEANDARTKAWWRRRVRRQTASRPPSA